MVHVKTKLKNRKKRLHIKHKTEEKYETLK